jgi:predicted transcriptional regulator
MARSGRVLAPTTVATLLHRLEKSGWVKHRTSGKVFVYQARVDKVEAANGALARLVRSFFGGRISALAAQLLESEQLTPEDLEAMRKLLEKREA